MRRFCVTAAASFHRGHMSPFSGVVAEPRRVPSCRAGLVSADNEMRSAGVAVRTRVAGRALVAGSSQRGCGGRFGRTSAVWEAPDTAGWEFLAERRAGDDGNCRPARTGR
jgi:hypothetical protein